VDSSGNVYIADAGDNRIGEVSNGIIMTAAGSNSSNYSGGGGPAISAGLNKPFSVAVDAGGNLHIADRGNYRIRKVTSDGNITTIASTGNPGNSGDGGPATSATVNSLNAIAVGPGGEIYFTDVRASDGKQDAPRVAVVSKTFAAQLLHGQDPTGKRFRAGYPDGKLIEIVGVAEDGKYFSLAEAPQPAMWRPFETS